MHTLPHLFVAVPNRRVAPYPKTVLSLPQIQTKQLGGSYFQQAAGQTLRAVENPVTRIE